ncbi:RimJ/RimL family protein N-acetyltransferase [Krasilnikovia cinnamomea]|uniref:RimJ/RimL family protein N-acetyltransferase n=1 Tax=Krasilnikovia cinnamomea TaxID=349313 RepID=A0A4Q7ZKR5_9ACTN|nr:GNAT family N-acetyltransferase [Krasilnikovia cinnamomea]RZU51141.1 RimJ/RimL family protein N-acetyltransferase [Krasilnikovia cinnamomea]
MINDHWPLYGLRLRTPRLELRLPGPDDLAALADRAAEGVHDPDTQPFTTAWTDAEPDQRARATMQWHWSMLGRWQPDDWSLNLVAVADGVVVGTQDVRARTFAALREVGTGSWLGRAHHGRGYGTEMRAAVLHLAFEGLGAEYATSAAFADNDASYGVSRKLGYADDGVDRHLVRGAVVVSRRLRLDRAGWAAARTVPVSIEGLAPCLPMFGLPPGDEP